MSSKDEFEDRLRDEEETHGVQLEKGLSRPMVINIKSIEAYA